MAGRSDWLRMALELVDAPLGEFRGAQEAGRYRFLGCDRDVPVGYVGCGTFNRWASWEGGPGPSLRESSRRTPRPSTACSRRVFIPLTQSPTRKGLSTAQGEGSEWL